MDDSCGCLNTTGVGDFKEPKLVCVFGGQERGVGQGMVAFHQIPFVPVGSHNEEDYKREESCMPAWGVRQGIMVKA